MNAPIFALAPVLPEIIVSLGALGLILLGALKGEKFSWLVSELAVAILGIAIILVLRHPGTTGADFSGSFIDDAFGRYMKVLSLIGALVTLLLSLDFTAREKFA